MAICRSTCAPAAAPKPRRMRCWPKWWRRSKNCWATGSTRAPAIRWKWWSAACCASARRTVAVAESCTGGMLGARITSTPGSSDYFVGGFITYSNALKIRVAGSKRGNTGAVRRGEPGDGGSHGGGRARAYRVATYAVSITGVAGPDGGSEEKPVGLVYIGIAGPEGVAVYHRRFLGDRQRIRVFTTQMALDLLRRRLQGLS